MRNFEAKFSAPDWSTVRKENVDEYMDCFITRMNGIYKECFPLKSKLIGKIQVTNPWMTQHLKEKQLKQGATVFI